MNDQDPTFFFWKLAGALLNEPQVTKSTMMGFPCLRVDAKFFACADPRTGDLIVKLPAERVGELIVAGTGLPFAPAGRKFREWVVISGRDARTWNRFLKEARAFVGSADG